MKDEQKKILKMAQTNVERLGRLIDNILDFQRIESGKIMYDLQEGDIHSAVSEVCNSMGLLAKEKNLGLRLEMEEGLPEFKFDRDKIIQVLINLVSNAIHNTESGHITLSVKMENDMLHIRVNDTGCGISDEDLPKLFVPFTQIWNNQAKKKSGAGLGLAITKDIVLAHHGKIWAESEAGKGSVFHVILPLKNTQAA